MPDLENYKRIVSKLHEKNITLVAVSKTKPVQDIEALYNAGQRDFGENYVQELLDKQAQLPKDIKWHFIGHLQSNKVKYIAPFVHIIHGVDSESLLKEINKQAIKNDRSIDCLLQIYIAKEDTKFGMDENEALTILNKLPHYQHCNIRGLMGMASNTEDNHLIEQEFKWLKNFSDRTQQQLQKTDFNILSMGMSADYDIAIEQGSNMVRMGSLLFGERK